MDQLIRSGFVLSDGVEFIIAGNTINVLGQIECLGNIRIDVAKVLVVLGGEGADREVQTIFYSYNAALGGVGNILRYDSPSIGEEPHPILHHNYHHKHTYDTFSGDVRGKVELIHVEEDIPTLGEMIQEASDWYYAHYDEIERESRRSTE